MAIIYNNMNGGSIEDLVNDLTKVNGQIKNVKSKVETLGGKMEEIDTIFTELKTAVLEIDEVGKESQVVSEIEPTSSAPESEGIFSGLFSSSPKEETNTEEQEAPSDLNNAMIVESSEDSQTNDLNNESQTNDELNNGMIADESDKEMIDALKIEEPQDQKGGKSRKHRKRANAKSKKLRGGKQTKKRQQKKGGAKKSKRRA